MIRVGFLYCGLFALISSNLSAQNQDSVAIRKYYEENTIYWLGSTKYYKNNQSYPLKNLKNEVKFSPDAVYELQQYRRTKTYQDISLFACYGFLVSSFIVKDQNAKLGLLAGCVISGSIAIPLSVRASKHLGRTIWLHNRDVLLK